MGELLASPRPDIVPEVAIAVAARMFGLEADAVALPSERDRNFRLDTADGPLCLKIAHPLEARGVVEMQALALEHVARVDPELPVPRVLRSTEGERVPTVDLEGSQHSVLLVSFLEGSEASPDVASPRVRAAIAAMLARLDRALSSFFHPLGNRSLLWDVARLGELRQHLDCVARDRRELVARWLNCFDRHVNPALSAFRHQVIHGDLNPANVLLDPECPHVVRGIVDFGDIVHAPLVLDPAVAAAYQCFGQNDVKQVMNEFVDSFSAVTPLDSEERRLLPELVACRLVQSMVIGAWRATLDPDNANYILADQDDCWETLGRLEALGGRSAPSLGRSLERRRAALGPALSLSYELPIRPVRGEGVWLVDIEGARYLDAYNNVPQVGHSHPEVVDAVARQLRDLTTNTRYLVDGVVAYADRLTSLMPEPLAVVMFVNSGSEANDLAYQIATVVTGNYGAIFSECAYHGCTWATTAMSPEEFGPERGGAWVESIAPPHPLRPAVDAPGQIASAIDALASRGHAPAMLITDTIFSSDGIFPAPVGYLNDLYAAVREAGGLCVADEVQAGFARVGTAFWGFALDGAVPDIVTLGKPMGNGYPMGAVVTTRQIANEFARGSHFFSTFAGSPVAAAAGSAVLDVIEREGLAEHAQTVGGRLRERISSLGAPSIVDVRGAGLFVGVELDDAEHAGSVVEEMRRRRVLIGRTGAERNVLKIRPPLVFDETHAAVLVEALTESLAGAQACREGSR